MIYRRSIAWGTLIALLSCGPLAASAQVAPRPTGIVAATRATEPIQTQQRQGSGAVSTQQQRVPGVQQRRAIPGTVSAPVSTQRYATKGRMANAVFGTIVLIRGNILSIRSRSGQIRTVDATPAMTEGTVSAPLFIGKLVVAEGVARTDGVLTAARVSRLPQLNGANSDR